MGSHASITTSNMDIGPCIVNFDSTDLGGTLGNVTVNFKYGKSKMVADQTGANTLRDEAISDIEVTVETMFAETRDKDKLTKLFPNATIIPAGGGETALQFEDKVATRQLPLAKILKLHPIVEGNSAADKEWVFYKAVPSEESQYVFSPTEQAKLKIVWKIYLDDSVTPNRMFRHGDDSL